MTAVWIHFIRVSLHLQPVASTAFTWNLFHVLLKKDDKQETLNRELTKWNIYRVFLKKVGLTFKAHFEVFRAWRVFLVVCLISERFKVNSISNLLFWTFLILNTQYKKWSFIQLSHMKVQKYSKYYYIFYFKHIVLLLLSASNQAENII